MSDKKDWVVTVLVNDPDYMPLDVFEFNGSEKEVKEKMMTLVNHYRYNDLNDVMDYPASVNEFEKEEERVVAHVELSYRNYVIIAMPKTCVKPLAQVQISEENPLLDQLTSTELEQFFDYADDGCKILTIFENAAEVGKDHVKDLHLDAYTTKAIDFAALGRDMAENSDEYFPLKSERVLKVSL